MNHIYNDKTRWKWFNLKNYISFLKFWQPDLSRQLGSPAERYSSNPMANFCSEGDEV